MPRADSEERIDPNVLYATLLGVPAGVPRFLIEGNVLRGRRLFLLQTQLAPAVQAFGEIVGHSEELKLHFGEHAELTGLVFLIERFGADVEVAVEALLAGRHGVLANTMRDVMEMEWLLRDFARDPSGIRKWLLSDDQLPRDYFRPHKVRDRLASDLFPGKRVELPDAQEYAFHSKSLHVTPGSPQDWDNVLAKESDARALLFYSYEIIEHARRFFSSIYMLIRALGQDRSRLLDRELPASLDTWKRAMETIAETTQHLPAGVFPPRIPKPKPQGRHETPRPR